MPIILDFDAASDTNDYSEDGFTITTATNNGNDLLAISPTNYSTWYVDSPSLAINYIGFNATLTRDGGGSFSLGTINLDGVYQDGNQTITFIANLTAGGTQVFNFAIDTALGWQTFDFGNVEVTSLVFDTQDYPYYKFDQIEINPNTPPDAVDDDLTGTFGGSGGNVLLIGPEMDASVQAYLATQGMTSTIIDGSALEGTDLSSYSAIWVGWFAAVTDTGSLAANLANFIDGGGNILVEPFTNVIQYLPNGADIIEGSFIGGDDVVIVDTTCALMEGLTDADLSNWLSSYHDTFNVADYDEFILQAENFIGSDITLLQNYGAGHIVITGQDPSYHIKYGDWHGETGDNSPQLEFVTNALTLTSALTDEDTVIVIDGADLLANDTDPDNDTLVISEVSPLSNLGVAVVLNPDGTISYDPTGVLDYLAEGDIVEDTFTYTVSDGNGGTDTATVTFTVVGVNDGPTAPIDGDPTGDGIGVNATIAEDLAVGSEIGLDADSTDAEGDTLSYYFKDGIGNPVQTLGLFTVDASTGVVTLAGAINYEMATNHSLTIFVSDGAAEASTTFNVTVTNIVEHLFTPNNDGTAGTPIDFNALPDGAYDFDGAQYDALAGNDFVYLPNLATVDAGNPWDYNRTFNASAGNDVVQGGDGNDIVSGGDGNDTLFGADGDDRLVGSSGNDILGGGDGSDKLTGSSGKDIFIFTDSELGTSKLGEHDVITDFQQGTDKIDISALYDGGTYNGLKAGALSGTAANAFKVGYYSSGGKTWLEGDVDGNGTADWVIEMSGSYKLKGSDIVVGPSVIATEGAWHTATGGGLNWLQHHQDDYFA